MNNPQQPQEYDAVLGGNSPSLESAAVLGGIEGVKLRLRNPDVNVRIAALEQALNYGEQGLNLVIEGLNDEDWDVQIAAYLILNSRTERRIKQILLEFNPEWLKLKQIEVVTVNNFGEIVQRQQGIARYFTEDLGNGVTLEMAAIPGGSFMMGSPENELERRDTESPQHQVTVPSFFMGKYPVTQAQYQAIMGTNPSCFKGSNRPVERISWHDAVNFCHKLSQKTGRNYRLPSEAEWEYACRAGTTTPFHFGETITTDLANYYGYSTYGDGIKGIYRKETTEVGSFKVANNFGLYDMHGNVLEWCQDNWHSNYKGAPTDGSAWLNNTQGSDGRLLRGGTWGNDPFICRSAFRPYFVLDDSNYHYIGFRVVCSGARLKNPDSKVRIAALEQALNYGEQGLDLVIAGLNDESWNVQDTAYCLLKHRMEERVKQVLIIFELKSSVGIDYNKLRDLLAARKWKEADAETRRIMLIVTKREKEGFFEVSGNFNNFPCVDLRTIDKLWVKYSNGRFGFSVQKQIHQNLLEGRKSDREIWCKFSDSVGWSKARGYRSWLNSSDTLKKKVPKGHFPKMATIYLVKMFPHLETCGL